MPANYPVSIARPSAAALYRATLPGLAPGDEMAFSAMLEALRAALEGGESRTTLGEERRELLRAALDLLADSAGARPAEAAEAALAVLAHLDRTR